jgi:hypothetical protein
MKQHSESSVFDVKDQARVRTNNGGYHACTSGECFVLEGSRLLWIELGEVGMYVPIYIRI